MQHSSNFESKVLTAPPQRLQLMLIEGAIRFARQAEDAFRADNRVAASAALMRAIDIVGELLAVARSHKSDLNKRMADLYMFLFRRISEAKINADTKALGEALRLLEYERQTWQMLCDKLGSEIQDAPATPRAHAFDSNRGNAKSGFSLEA
jgi:flagellar protein FliS